MRKYREVKKGKSKSYSFSMVRHDIMDSPAWLSLDTVARCVWLLILRRYYGSNNGLISLSCREVADNTGVSKDTAGRAFHDLIDRGLIVIAVNSAFNIKTKKARRWRLTHIETFNNHIRKPPSNEWRAWKNIGQISGTR